MLVNRAESPASGARFVGHGLEDSNTSEKNLFIVVEENLL
jgi:hypothetical protein